MLAFVFGIQMDIHTAAKYMKHGYRIRRSSWVSSPYIYQMSGVIMSGGRSGPDFLSNLILEDLIADDWELITEGIIKDFPLTYQD